MAAGDAVSRPVRPALGPRYALARAGTVGRPGGRTGGLSDCSAGRARRARRGAPRARRLSPGRAVDRAGEGAVVAGRRRSEGQVGSARTPARGISGCAVGSRRRRRWARRGVIRRSRPQGSGPGGRDRVAADARTVRSANAASIRVGARCPGGARPQRHGAPAGAAGGGRHRAAAPGGGEQLVSPLGGARQRCNPAAGVYRGQRRAPPGGRGQLLLGARRGARSCPGGRLRTLRWVAGRRRGAARPG